jgi:asparagine synthetase B (glutamine-hydrolysing)
MPHRGPDDEGSWQGEGVVLGHRRLAIFPNKALLANSPARALPRNVIERKKTGFGIPIGRWLQDRPGSRSWPKELVAAYEASAWDLCM